MWQEHFQLFVVHRRKIAVAKLYVIFAVSEGVKGEGQPQEAPNSEMPAEKAQKQKGEKTAGTLGTENV